MSITPIGWVLIPLGLVLFFLRPGWLYVLTVFFVPFSASAVISRGTGESASGFSPFLYFGFLMLLRECVTLTLTRRFQFRFARSVRKPLYLLMNFVLVCLSTLVMPMLIAGRLQIMDRPTIEYALVPLQYSLQTVNHALSLIFDAVVAAVIAHRCLDLRRFYETLRIYFISGIFVCLWGWMQFGCYLAGVAYPATIFNTSSAKSQYEAVLESLGVVRVSSVAIEPSFLARVLVGILVIGVAAIYRRTPIFNRGFDYFILALVGSTLIITTSSTGYVGVALLLALMPFLPRQRNRSKFALVASGFVVLAALVTAYFTIPAAADLLNSQLFNKAEGGSVVERAVIISNDFQYFLQYPILGIGWDCAPTHDVIVGLLANCGICGAAAFTLLIGSLILALYKSCSLSNAGERRDGPPVLMLLTLTITCVVYIISSGIETPDFWMTLALSIAAVGIGYNLRQQAPRDPV
ncbi:MAG: O-antigen ligase family protein [Acidobacteriota bacterium]